MLKSNNYGRRNHNTNFQTKEEEITTTTMEEGTIITTIIVIMGTGTSGTVAITTEAVEAFMKTIPIMPLQTSFSVPFV